MGLRTIAAVVDEDDPMNNVAPAPTPTFLLFDDQPLSPISIGTSVATATTSHVETLNAPLPKAGSKRKAEPEPSSSANTGAMAGAVNCHAEAGTSYTGSRASGFTATGDYKSDNISTASCSNNKKIRRVQTKVKFAPTTNSGKTRNK